MLLRIHQRILEDLADLSRLEINEAGSPDQAFFLSQNEMEEKGQLTWPGCMLDLLYPDGVDAVVQFILPQRHSLSCRERPERTLRTALSRGSR